ncbi:hypothetical protein CDEST_05119 [Colletotrichum destructivum]|uniref:Uncharacterized protein n=1 Tax=Colletotrichum destructivum TaxID=34406 RepID=A0AAX4I9X3_9PEZI|nr:hypothetical protein CDEST_05119 [Colletotrichum destructivum]
MPSGTQVRKRSCCMPQRNGAAGAGQATEWIHVGCQSRAHREESRIKFLAKRGREPSAVGGGQCNTVLCQFTGEWQQASSGRTCRASGGRGPVVVSIRAQRTRTYLILPHQAATCQSLWYPLHPKNYRVLSRYCALTSSVVNMPG